MFTGDIVEYHSACYCGDGHFHDWPGTLEAIRSFNLDAIAPGRGDALQGRDMVNAALDSTKDFVRSTYLPAARVALKGGTLNAEDGLTRFAIRYMCTHHYFSIDKAKASLDWSPRVSLDEGIALTVDAL